MTCGEETEAECLKAVEADRDKFIFQEVRNITPAVKALNTMIGQCETPYLVPLDADMILYPGAFRRLSWATKMMTGNMNWHSVLFPLWDTLTEEKIMALKVFRTEVVKKHLYKDDNCPDIEHYQNLTENGYVAKNLMDQPPIGDHVVKGNFFCYAKYRDLYMTLRTHPEQYLESHFKGGTTMAEKAYNHFNFFEKQFKDGKGEHYLYCIAGMVEGLTAPKVFKSKDLSQREMKFDPSNGLDFFWDWYEKAKKPKRLFV
jgi:hypothetical protein